MQIKALVDRVKIHQFDLVRLDLALLQPRRKVLKELSREFVVIDRSLQAYIISDCLVVKDLRLT